MWMNDSNTFLPPEMFPEAFDKVESDRSAQDYKSLHR